MTVIVFQQHVCKRFSVVVTFQCIISIHNDHTQIMLQVTTKKTGDKPVSETVEVALNPEELDMDTAAMQAKYDQTVREQQSQLEKEDLSDMVAEHAAKQKVC